MVSPVKEDFYNLSPVCFSGQLEVAPPTAAQLRYGEKLFYSMRMVQNLFVFVYFST